MRTGTQAMAPRRVVATAALWAAAVLLMLAVAAPAHAFVTWAHDGIPAGSGPSTCYYCHGDGGSSGATNESCTTVCHPDFEVTPGATVDGRFAQTCWSCHAPGADTSGLSSSSAACSQECHLFSPATKTFSVAYAHGTEPHLGAVAPYGACLDCHATSVAWYEPGASPHHDGAGANAPSCEFCHDGGIASAQVSHDGAACEDCHDGMDFPAAPAACVTCHAAATFGAADCLACHASQVHTAAPNVGSCTTCHDEGYRQHAGDVACKTCHTNTPKAHHETAAPAVKACRGCHAMKHAGAKVSGARCAGCHKGNAPSAKPRAQHSSTITKKFVCGGCHAKKLHAKAEGANTTCRSCHKGKFHAGQANVATSACVKCHSGARGHAGGLRCVLCHKSVVHDPTP